ncbi:MAG: hypothetical protein KatS3mg096_514 [Candidatus Parcubacteria bacterium]|nr:MAG: hypothetical protein KatS3mg093_436 [Candidatus Parcubacteria bacterium]GIW67646.1 MAG: hypothetical protein KatS3mg096_514 [Candidatus Parcubacteria bacterium]
MKIFITLRKIFSFLSLLSLVVSIFLFFGIGVKISQTQATGWLDLRGLAYIWPFLFVGLGIIFLILAIIFSFIKKDSKWSLKKFLFRWLILFIVSIISFGLSILIAKI